MEPTGRSMNNSQVAAQAFAKNRAEELGFDLWDEFVVPLYFDKLSLDEIRKPVLFEGGRGCGKTSLLRYLSHATQLSEKRNLTQESLPKQIGLYFRADTQYLRTFRGDSLSDDGWIKAFEHELCLSIALEITTALKSLCANSKRREVFPGIDSLDLSVLQDFDDAAPKNIQDLTAYLRQRKNKFTMWLNNSDDQTRPAFFPIKQLLLELIKSIRNQLPFLSEIVFFVFIDEYENLLDYQMRVINTLLKHSESPLIFHIAAKRNGMVTRKTLGSEQLQERDDFRKFDVEEESAEYFDLFAAELFCFRLRKRNIEVGPSTINEDLLCSPSQLRFRCEDAKYKAETLAAARNILPGLSWLEAATYVLKDTTLRSKLQKQLQSVLALTDASLDAEQFIRDDAPIASVCTPAILHQGKPPRVVLEELERAAQKRPSKFVEGEWNHHYFAGSMFHLFLPLQRPCVLYAGFDSFLKLSGGNARHFLELCHLSMVESKSEPGMVDPVAIEKQAAAARAASGLFVKETQGSGDHGNRLFQVVNTLGQIFRMSHARPSQSEAERTHFAVTKHDLSESSTTILSECIKWSVVFVSPETKVKDDRLETNEYIFNPIYSPYFGISFNKGRKLDLKSTAAESILSGDRKQMDELVKSYIKAWKLAEVDQMSLFGSEGQ